MTKTRRYIRLGLLVLTLALGMAVVASCAPRPSQSPSFYNAGAADFTVTASEFVQLFLYHFDTRDAGRSLTLPSAADIVGALPSASGGQAFAFGVNAGGANPVTIIGGAGVTITPSAVTVAGNTTRTVFVVLDNATKGSEAVTVY